MNNRFDRRSRSLWMDVDVAPNACELEGDQSADTVIIGSGIAGISTAYELAIEGQKVIVLDRGPIAGGITARTSAHLAPLCDDLTSEMIRLRGEDVSVSDRRTSVLRRLAVVMSLPTPSYRRRVRNGPSQGVG